MAERLYLVTLSRLRHAKFIYRR